MAEFAFEVKLRDRRNSYNRFINYTDINSFVKDILKAGRVQYKLHKFGDGENSKCLVPTNWFNVAQDIRKIIDEFFEDNEVYKSTKGPRIYLDYYEENDYIDVSTSKPNTDEEKLLAVIDWYVC